MYENKNKAELIEMLDEKKVDNERLANTIRDLTEENRILSDQLSNRRMVQSGGLSGWLVSAPNPAYNGTTCGYQFRNGKAFIARVEGKDYTSILRQLKGDFGYEIREVDNYLELAQDFRNQADKNMIDMLGIPQAM